MDQANSVIHDFITVTFLEIEHHQWRFHCSMRATIFWGFSVMCKHYLAGSSWCCQKSKTRVMFVTESDSNYRFSKYTKMLDKVKCCIILVCCIKALNLVHIDIILQLGLWNESEFLKIYRQIFSKFGHVCKKALWEGVFSLWISLVVINTWLWLAAGMSIHQYTALISMNMWTLSYASYNNTKLTTIYPHKTTRWQVNKAAHINADVIKTCRNVIRFVLKRLLKLQTSLISDSSV